MNNTDILPKNKIEVLFVKRIVLITAIIIYALFAVSAFVSVSAENRAKARENTTLTSTNPSTYRTEIKYILKSIDGKLVVLNSRGDILEQTDTLVSILPESDRKKLEAGISVESDEDLRKLLEDFCS